VFQVRAQRAESEERSMMLTILRAAGDVTLIKADKVGKIYLSVVQGGFDPNKSIHAGVKFRHLARYLLLQNKGVACLPSMI
jgi:hypothetical protein